MTTPNKVCKLYMYRHDSRKIWVDHVEAEDWGDFVVIAIDGAAFVTPEAYDNMSQQFAQFSQAMKKQVLIVPRDWNIEFYGVEVNDEAVPE